MTGKGGGDTLSAWERRRNTEARNRGCCATEEHGPPWVRRPLRLFARGAPQVSPKQRAENNVLGENEERGASRRG